MKSLIEESKENFDKIITVLQARKPQVMSLIEYLEDKTVWKTAPASSYTKYHCCFEGGLFVHSVLVTMTLLRLRKMLYPSIPPEPCAIVGLFHDIGKVGAVNDPMYIPQTNEWKRNKLGQLYEINESPVFLDVPTRSLSYILKFVDLSDEEIQAIRYHDGQYCDENHCVANKERPLTRLLQMADVWSAGVIEK